MPIFEYVCEGCGARFEKLILSGTGERQLRCPKCGNSGVRKAPSVFGTSRGNSSASVAASNCAQSG